MSEKKAVVIFNAAIVVVALFVFLVVKAANNDVDKKKKACEALGGQLIGSVHGSGRTCVDRSVIIDLGKKS